MKNVLDKANRQSLEDIEKESAAEGGVFYLPAGREIELFEHSYRSKLGVLIKGPTGCGKTRFVQYMAEKLNRPLITVACNEDTSATDLLGRHLIISGETLWTDGPVTRAVRQGAILYLDEIAEARSDALVVIHSLTDHRRELFLDRTGETIVAPESFLLVASYNPGYQKSLREMKPSTRQRMVGLSFDFPKPEAEIEIVSRESGLEGKQSRRLVELANKIRNLSELSLLESASTRLLVATGKLIVAGSPPRLAAYSGIAEALTDEPDALAALKQLVDLTF